MIARKEMKCIAHMPPSKHKPNSGIFDIGKSEVVNWLVSQNDIKSMLFKLVIETGIIEMDEDGVYYPISNDENEIMECLLENKKSKLLNKLDENLKEKVKQFENDIQKIFSPFPSHGIKKADLIRRIGKEGSFASLSYVTLEKYLEKSSKFHWSKAEKRIFEDQSEIIKRENMQLKSSSSYIENHYLIYLKPEDKLSWRKIKQRAGEDFTKTLENFEFAMSKQSRFQWVDDNHDLFRDTEKQEVEPDEDYGEF